MGKKAVSSKVSMSLSDLNKQFGGTGGHDMLPTKSEGKEFGNKGKGKFGRQDEDSRADEGLWRGKGDRDGKGGFRGRDQDSKADEATNWRDGGDRR
eukprot:CAMPEP_0194504148 /NCGR_PEP_ID=MMETSP0253-20130528/28785_1 /TAXON_ID=2966 /ORGANISM="Noctiluca scintillans" /LENGTH=95 /DNA_ID=CAMNT_0039346509 /DNA_START=75 /DNA_END=358 /DNA_ORIENTATION=+